MLTFQRFSIRQKLILSMVTSLLLCLAISTALGLYLSSQRTRERVVSTGIPTMAGEIRSDILRQIGVRLKRLPAIAGDPKPVNGKGSANELAG